MPRSVKSRSYKKANYSRENKGFQLDTSTVTTAVNGLFQYGYNIVPAVNTQGTRTVGNFTITVPIPGNNSNAEMYWALVYIPQGTTANNLFSLTGQSEGSLYEPNQFVIASGVNDNSAGPIRIYTRMKRKLHSGDAVSLILGSTVQVNTMRGLVSYSIKYN